MNLELFILGCGGMMPLPNRHLTSMLLRREGDLFLFDCGEATQISLRRLNLKWKKISSIFISHTHADHITGLPGILMLSSQVDRDEPLYIYGPPIIKQYVESSRQVLNMYINYEIIVKEISGDDVIYDHPDFSIRTFPVNHTRTCVGYSFIEKERAGKFFPEKAIELGVQRGPDWSKLQNGESVTTGAGALITPAMVMGDKRTGRKISFITDTLYDEGFCDYVRGSDYLICEGMFLDELKESAREKKHLTAKQAAMIARDAQVGAMGLIHYSPRYTNADLKLLLKESKTIFENTFLTYDRQKIKIPYID